MPPKGRSKNTAGSAAQSPPHDDANTDDNTLDNPTPEDVQTVLAENRQLKERLTWLEAQFRSATPSDEASELPEPATPEKQDPKINIYEPIHEPRIAPPKKFSGKSSEFLSFMTQCEINFLMCPKTYAKDEKKVLFVIANLEDPALQWAREIFINPKHPYRTNYEAFSKALYSLYDNHTYHQDAEDSLLSLKHYAIKQFTSINSNIVNESKKPRKTRSPNHTLLLLNVKGQTQATLKKRRTIIHMTHASKDSRFPGRNMNDARITIFVLNVVKETTRRMITTMDHSPARLANLLQRSHVLVTRSMRRRIASCQMKKNSRQ